MFLRSLGRNPGLGLLALRVGVAAIFLFHGVQKWSLFSTAMEPGALPLLLRILAVIEPLAALGILLGLLTDYMALILAVVMIGAIYTKIKVWNVSFGGGWELDFLLLLCCVALVFLGGGKYSLETASLKKK